MIFNVYHACNQIMGSFCVNRIYQVLKLDLKKMNVNWGNFFSSLVYRNLPPPPPLFFPPPVSKLWRRCWVGTVRWPGNPPPLRSEISPQPTKVRSGKHADISRTLLEVMFVKICINTNAKTLYIENTERSS